MSIQFSKAGYTLSCNTGGLTIGPGLEPLHLNLSELEKLGLAVRDDYQVSNDRDGIVGALVGGILGTLSQALRKLEGPQHNTDRRNVRKAMVLIGGLNEKTAQGILDQRPV